jgi:hypothetical protein
MYEMEGPQLAALQPPADCSADMRRVPYRQAENPVANRGCPALACRGSLRCLDPVLTVNEFLLPTRWPAQVVSENHSKIL